jgi:hypothetical protein
MLPDPPSAARTGDTYAFGRYRHPIPEPDVRAPGWLGRLRLKEWHYVSLTTERWFVGLALAQLGYVANAFCYVVDRRAPSQRREYEALSPAGLGLSFAPSSVSGETIWRKGKDRIAMRWEQGWRVEVDIGIAGTRLAGSCFVEPGESLALLYDLGGGRPAYTHKAAALPARGALTLGGERIDAEGGLAGVDWTRSVARRETRWKWASFSGRAPDGRTLGLNLSAEVYDDAENALFVGGRVSPLSGVRFLLPADLEREPWRIEGPEVALEFRPVGARRQKVDLKVVRSAFVQPYGTFHGSVRPPGGEPIRVDGVFGVVEDHVAVW